MIYLSKTNQNAIDFVANFLDNNWLEQNDGTCKYQNIGYSEIKNPVADFRAFFVDDQDNKCCYCCRDIVNDNRTELEHIIPRTKSEFLDFNPYYGLSNILQANVIPQNIFETTLIQLAKPPFPHHIAYQNIVASCNGRTFESSDNFTCCNRERKDDFVPPFNLMVDSIKYLQDGTIVYQPDTTKREYFDILNLNKEVLTSIRRLWFLFSKSQLSLTEVLQNNTDDNIIKEKIIRFAISNSLTAVDDLKLVETFSNTSLWNTFKDYSYFFDYYRSLN